MTEWVQKWKENNWKTVVNKDVKNKENLLELDSVVSLMEKVKWVGIQVFVDNIVRVYSLKHENDQVNRISNCFQEYVQGHAEIVGNESADDLAKEGAELYTDGNV